MRKLLFVATLLVLLLPLTAAAQDAPKVEIFGGYSYFRADDKIDADLHGWNASVAGNVNKWFGVVGDFSGHYDNFDGPGFNTDINLHLFTFGPKFAYRKYERVTPYGHVLLGAARTHTKVVTAAATVRDTDTDFALIAGGGLDLNVNKSLAVRLFQTDYVFIRDGSLDTNFHNFRVSTGLVLKLGEH